MSNKRYILSVDLGTTGCKVIIFDEEGNVKSYSYNEYPLYTSEGCIAEQDPMEWWSSVVKSIKKALLKSNLSPSRIAAVGITGQSTSIVVIDKDGKPIRPAILYMDCRAENLLNKLTEQVGKLSFPEAKIYTNLLWLRKFEPETYKRIWKVVDAKEFIAYKITGNVTYDAITLPRERIKILNNITNIPEEFFGEPHTYNEPVGMVHREAANITGLLEGTPVIVGPWDGMCNVIGSGLIDHGTAMDVAGTTEIIAVVSKEKLPIVTHKHIVKGLWLVYTSLPLGIAHRWLRNLLFANQGTPFTTDPYEIMNLMASKVDVGAHNLIFIPVFQGEYLKRHLRGAIIGLSFEHDAGHIIRALFEGVAYHLKLVFDNIEKHNLIINEVRVSGGGAKSKLWNQIKADVTGKSFKVLKVHETGCLGIAILVSTVIGLYKNIHESIKNMVHIAYEIKPRKEIHEKYKKYYSKYAEALNFIDNFFKEGNLDKPYAEGHH